MSIILIVDEIWEVYMRGMMKEPLNVVIRMIVLNVLR